MENLIVIGILAIIVILIIIKLRKDKKNGIHCSGCPHSKGNSNCHCKK